MKGPDLVRLVPGGDNEISPGCRHQFPAVRGLRRLGLTIIIPHCDHLAVQKVTKRSQKSAVPIPNVDNHRAKGLHPHDGEDRSILAYRHGSRVRPRLFRVVAPQDNGARVATVGIEERNPLIARIPGHNRVPGPRSRSEKSRKLPGTRSLPSPGHQMGPGRGEDPHLVRAQVRYHDASVRQPEDTADQIKEVRFLSLDRADRHRRFRSDSPPEARPIGRAGVLGDQDACAVAGLGSRQVGALVRPLPIQVLLAGDGGQAEEECPGKAPDATGDHLSSCLLVG